MLRPRLLEDAQETLGAEGVRPSDSSDIVEGLQPQIAIEPVDAVGVARALAWAAQQKLAVVVRGNGTRIGWGPAPHGFDILLSMRRLQPAVDHRHGDLTATVSAGATLAGLNRVIAAQRQWLPLDPPAAERTTIGGLVATNDSGPRRHRYGAPRDLIIGIEIVRVDGRLARGGGIVVKNVAGYDLPRLFTGSFGALGVIVSATFKLFPLAPASRTVLAAARDGETAAAIVATLSRTQLTPSALEIAGPPFTVAVRYESIEAAVDAQAERTRAIAASAGASVRTLGGADEAAFWTAHDAQIWEREQAVIKVTMRPADLGPVLALLESTCPKEGWAAAGRAGLGVLYVTIRDDADGQARAIGALRDRLPPARGSAVVLRGSSDLKKLVDVWGPLGDGAPLMRTVKRQFDPGGILNPGRGPGGL